MKGLTEYQSLVVLDTEDGSDGSGVLEAFSLGTQPPHVIRTTLPGGLEMVTYPAGQAPPRVDTNPKTAFGAVKPPLALVPGSALAQEAAVFALGARKYGAYNWRQNAVSTMTYLHAAMRHLAAYTDGRNTDPESGCSDLAHVRACCAILLDAAESGQLIDDRPIPGRAQETMDRLSDAERARQKAETT